MNCRPADHRGHAGRLSQSLWAVWAGWAGHHGLCPYILGAWESVALVSDASLPLCYALGLLARLPTCGEEPALVWLRGARPGSLLGACCSGPPPGAREPGQFPVEKLRLKLQAPESSVRGPNPEDVPALSSLSLRGSKRRVVVSPEPGSAWRGV